MAKILVIEDDVTTRFAVVKALRKGGHDVAEASSIAEARKHVAETAFEMVLTDLRLSVDDDGIEYIRELREGAEAFDGVIVAMTGNASVDSAVKAMRHGADDYLTKPLVFEELALSVPRWLEQRTLRQRVRLYERLERSRTEEFEALGNSPAWLAALGLATRLSSIPLPPIAETGGPSTLPCILLLGETGAGKGILARHIHAEAVRLAPDDEPPFVHVNCSALPATLVEGELFGHERGAFTDARDARPGLFEMADGGTIFLDEVSEMPLELQSKLLLVVENGRFRRVGGTKERRVRARVIAASNQDLAQRVAEGRFRRDLLYRLNAFTVRIPALRERGNDAATIAQASLERFCRQFGRPAVSLSDAGRAAVLAHDWPGNVRELVNACQRAAMLCAGSECEPADLGLAPAAQTGAGTPPRVGGGELTFDFVGGIHRAADVERELIIQALRFTRGNVSRAARLIGMQRSSLRYRIERYQLADLVKREEEAAQT
ncbi:MAG: sigma-54-dependent Fis family transcriptional regulator [Phycisphaeraceae bacterium]|nr:sigma-54-dependent Fis family transcriptional regulator [Phycisphaeraceae bacterium]